MTLQLLNVLTVLFELQVEVSDLLPQCDDLVVFKTKLIVIVSTLLIQFLNLSRLLVHSLLILNVLMIQSLLLTTWWMG